MTLKKESQGCFQVPWLHSIRVKTGWMSRYQASNNNLILGDVRTETLIVHHIELTLFGHTQRCLLF